MPRRRQYDPKGPRPEPVDLGLSQLISAIESAGSTPNAPLRDGVSGTPADPQPGILIAAGDEYHSLERSGAWGELVTLTEGKLRTEGAGTMVQAEARAWWVRAQLELKGMPLAMLAGPLDNLAALLLKPAAKDEESVEARVRALVLPLLREVSRKLLEAGDQDLAIGLMERRFRLEGGGQTELLRAVTARLARGAPRPKDRHGMAQYEKLQALQAELERQIPCDQGKSVPAADRVPAAAEPPKAFRYPGRSARLVLFGVMLVLLILAGLLSWQFIEEQPESAGNPSQPSVALLAPAVETAAPAQLLPQTERITRLSYLDAVLYDLKNTPSRVPLSLPEQDRRPREDRRQAAQERREPAEKMDKERVDTSSPVESPEMEARRKAPSRDGQPEIDPPERDGFTPFEMARRNRKEEGRAEFREFPVNEQYTILVKTKVMPKASVYGAPLGELERGDRVAVVAQEGYWLKIRSKHGRVGFILAQDAATDPP